MKGTIRQWAALMALMMLGAVCVFFLAGEIEVSFSQFIIIKSASLLAFVGCYCAGRWLYRNGYLPEVEE